MSTFLERVNFFRQEIQNTRFSTKSFCVEKYEQVPLMLGVFEQALWESKFVTSRWITVIWSLIK